MNILGISAFYHDRRAALLRDGEIIAAAQEERFSRKKHDPRFPKHAAEYCLREGGITIDQVDCLAFYDKPLLKFERLLETYRPLAPRLLFVPLLLPSWLKENCLSRTRSSSSSAMKGKCCSHPSPVPCGGGLLPEPL